jgi:hypothetical protein
MAHRAMGHFLYARIEKHVSFDLHHIESRIALIIQLDKIGPNQSNNCQPQSTALPDFWYTFTNFCEPSSPGWPPLARYRRWQRR